MGIPPPNQIPGYATANGLDLVSIVTAVMQWQNATCIFVVTYYIINARANCLCPYINPQKEALLQSEAQKAQIKL